MAQQLKALIALPEEEEFIPSTPMAAYMYVYDIHTHTVHTHIIHTHNQKSNKKQQP